jgi:hypothetical protein
MSDFSPAASAARGPFFPANFAERASALRKPSVRAGLFAFLALMAVQAAEAQSPSPAQRWTLDKAVERSGLIFEGTVTDIAFRDSDPQPDTDMGVPHTFVTYRVDDVVRGQLQSRRMTLRFLGGWSSQSGQITLAAGGPLFSVGDHDLLFVTGNGKAMCPLVGCELGRFRVQEGQVFTDKGLSVRIDPNAGLRTGPDRLPPEQLTMTFPPAPEARLRAVRRQLAEGDLSDAERATLQRRLRDMSGPRVIGVSHIVGEPPVDPPPEPPLDVATFKRALAAISQQYPTDGNPVPSVSPRDPIVVYALAPSRPKQAPGPVSPPPSEPRTLEQQLLERNNGNPVLGVQP